MIDRRGGGHDLGIAAVASGWITLLLVTDRWSDLLGQTMWGAASWAVLACLLRGEAPLVRSQVAVVVVFATVVEYTFSPLLGVYLCRLGNVPAFVPPGHGMVYLASLALGRWATAPGLRVALVVVMFGVLGHRMRCGACSAPVGSTHSWRSGSAVWWCSWPLAGRRRSTWVRS